MINLGQVTLSSKFAKPKSFILIRKVGEWLNGRFVEEAIQLDGTGIIDPLSTKEIQMLPEGDSISGGIRIYTKMPVYTTRNIDSSNEGTSDEIKFHGLYYKVINTKDYSDFGFFHVIAVRILGS